MDNNDQQKFVDAYLALPHVWAITSSDAHGEPVRRFMSAARDFASSLVDAAGIQRVSADQSREQTPPGVGILVPVGGTRPTLSALEFAALMAEGPEVLTISAAIEYVQPKDTGEGIAFVDVRRDLGPADVIAAVNLVSLEEDDPRRITRRTTDLMRMGAAAIDGAGGDGSALRTAAEGLDSYLPAGLSS